MPRWKSVGFYPVCAAYPAERRRPGCGEFQGPNSADMDRSTRDLAAVISVPATSLARAEPARTQAGPIVLLVGKHFHPVGGGLELAHEGAHPLAQTGEDLSMFRL